MKPRLRLRMCRSLSDYARLDAPLGTQYQLIKGLWPAYYARTNGLASFPYIRVGVTP